MFKYIRLVLLALTSIYIFSCTIQSEPIPSKPIQTKSGSKTEEGKASVYSDKLEGKQTASGASFEQNKLTAASKTKALGSKVKVINKKNGESVTVEITDRGPYVKGRAIDLSKSAAQKIQMPENGLADVEIQEVK